MEHLLDDGIQEFTGRSNPCDSFVSENVPDTDRMVSYSSLHGSVEPLGFSAEVPSISVDDFPLFG
jgi:hypothetical protein